jgi:peptidoglycan/xylan/chitin deacetylase (PgdA/CDA1 family)
MVRAGAARRRLDLVRVARSCVSTLPSGAVGAADRKELERWAEALTRSDVAELRAAGRAIKGLCAENAELARRLDRLELRRDDGPDDPDDRPAGPAAPAPGPRRARRSVPWRRIGIVAAAAVVVAASLGVAARAAAPELEVTGIPAAGLVGAAALPELVVSAPADAEWLLDGKPLAPERDGALAVWRAGTLADGEHELVLRRSGRLFASRTRAIRFTVDTSAPVLELARPAVVRPGQPLELAGKLEPGATLVHRDRRIEVDDDGAFVYRLAAPGPQLVLTATDEAGNGSRWKVPVTVVPRRPAEPIRSVHVTAYAWANDELRAAIMELVRTKRVNAVQLDLKDESGEVGWASGVPLAKQIGAQLAIYDLPKALKQLHGLGVRVIGRIVCFRDPIHAAAAWKAGRRDEVIRTPDGSAYAKYGGFTNFAHPAVRKYNIDLAVAAAKLGVDEILYDYVRRPDGPLSSMVFPGLKGSPEAAIAGFLAESRTALAETDALLGASVFGVAATRPEEVAQDIPAMARHVDYIAPMLYPSHWGPGEYDVADPNAQPYDITFRSTQDFVKQVRGTGARVVNWLQDFSYGHDYGPAEVRAQIEASKDAGVDDFILWDAAVTYTAAALDTTARTPVLENVVEAPKGAPGPVRLPDPKPAAKPQQQQEREAAAAPAPKRPVSGLPPNELGVVPVVMHHMIRPDRVGEYDQTPAEFRAELEYLWKRGYAPVNVGDLVAGKLDVPAGTTPVVLTFDDATTYQLDFTKDGRVKPATAVGIMLEFAKTHPGFTPRGTFYVNRLPFGSDANAKRALRWLVENGFELGNHTHDHVPLRELDAGAVQDQIRRGERVIRSYVPSYRPTSLSLPLGSLPERGGLAVRGKGYGPYAVLLVGAGPAPSPFSKEFDPGAIPRIRTSHAGWKGEEDFAFSYWMKQLERSPERRYVSDGDPATITVPKGKEADVRPRFAGRVRAAA